MIAFTKKGRQRQKRLADSKQLRDQLVQQLTDLEALDASAHQTGRRIGAAADDMREGLQAERKSAAPTRSATIAQDVHRLDRLIALRRSR